MIADYGPVVAILAGAGVYLCTDSLSQMRRQERRSAALRAFNRKIRQWPRKNAAIVRLGLDCDMINVRQQVRRIEALEDDAAMGREADRVLRAIALAKKKHARFAGVLFQYAYNAGGKKRLARAISPVAEKGHRELVYNYRKGDRIQVFVNPDDEHQSFLVPNSAKGLAQDHRRRMRNPTWKMAVGVALLVAAAGMAVFGIAH